MILDYFECDKVEATPYTVTQAPNASGQYEDVEVAGTAINGLFWNTSIASRYFNTSWNVETVGVFATDEYSQLEKDGRLTILGNKYAIDSIDNVGSKNEVWLIGVRYQK